MVGGEENGEDVLCVGQRMVRGGLVVVGRSINNNGHNSPTTTTRCVILCILATPSTSTPNPPPPTSPKMDLQEEPGAVASQTK